MKKNIRLTLTGRQWDESGEELVTTTHVSAQAYEKNGTRYLFYEESSEETRSVTKNTIKQKGNLLELTKRGELNTRMVFQPGKEYLTDYATPYGSFQMEISTRSMDIHTEKDRLQIRIDYLLRSRGMLLSRCQLIILAE